MDGEASKVESHIEFTNLFISRSDVVTFVTSANWKPDAQLGVLALDRT